MTSRVLGNGLLSAVPIAAIGLLDWLGVAYLRVHDFSNDERCLI
jgi:hypothetical protein